MRRVLVSALILLLVAISMVNVQATDLSKDATVTWEVIDKTVVEGILGEVEGQLLLRVSGKVCRFDVNGTGGLQELSKEEILALNTGSGAGSLREIDASQIHTKDGILHLDQLPILDVSSYIAEDRRFYENNPEYEAQPMHYVVKQRQLSAGGSLIYVITYMNTYIPAPYTPSYADVVLIRDGSPIRLPLERNFRLEGVWENQDGSLWLAGSMRNGRVTTEKSLYLVKKDLSVTHINAVLKKNYIEVLGQGLNGVIINAQTVAMGPYVPGAADPASADPYSTANSGILSIDSSLKKVFRPENPAGYKQVYLSAGGTIYGIKDDGRELYNLTENKSFLLAADDRYDRLVSQLDQAGDPVQVSPPRTDRDGTAWYVKDQRIIHRVGNREWVFARGLDVLMYPVSNLFIDKTGGKWFLGPAGIAYYAWGTQQAVNMNPLIDGGLSVGDYDHLYVDDNQRVWHFGEVIRCYPYGGHTVVAPQSSLIQGFEPVFHQYLEKDDKGIFVYQQQNPDSTYCIKILTIDRQGNIAVETFQSEAYARQALMAGTALLIHLENGLLKVENGQAVFLTHPLIEKDIVLQAVDQHTYAFIGPYRIVMGRL